MADRQALDLLQVMAPLVPVPDDAQACVAKGIAKDPALAAALCAGIGAFIGQEIVMPLMQFEKDLADQCYGDDPKGLSESIGAGYCMLGGMPMYS